ncbi:hypothetical protein NIES4071_58000 [Calothrix sp. NIES-4071]|nr:hypothetical protein NIES4071_58000 [Calothrix sp. NIES-4071]BAZ60107.1 hypothetical protein NIES4105_57950 [Calothrix sp. NIES-4105]
MRKIVKGICTLRLSQLKHEEGRENNSHCSSDSQFLMTEFAALLTIHKSLVKSLQFNPAVLDEAKKVAFLIEEDSGARVEALEDLASALAQAGRSYEAKEVLTIVKNSPVVKAKELQKLAAALARAGTAYTEEAIDVFRTCENVARTIKHKPTRVKALKELVATIMRVGCIYKSEILLLEDN